MAVADAVVAGERGVDDAARADHAVLGPRTFDDRAEADDGHLRRIDDGEEALAPALSEARDGDRRIGELGTAQTAAANAGYEVAQRDHDVVETLARDVVDGRGDETAGTQGRRHTDMDGLTRSPSFLEIGAVHLRHVAYG